jgi:hypothetical protein
MGKMLYSEPEYAGEFQVVEISSQLPDYKLCYYLNTGLGIKLTKKDDLKIFAEGRKKADIYSIYIYIQDNHTVFYYLRKTSQPGSLAPLSYLMVTKPLPADLFSAIIRNVAKINDVFDVREVPLVYENGTPAMIKTRQEINNILTDLELYLIEPKKPKKRFRNNNP